jgi:CheY-like chemotaxis protein
VTRRIRDLGPTGTVPIIAITSHAMLGDRGRILAAGCDGYFEKPIDPLTIMDEIHATLKQKE